MTDRVQLNLRLDGRRDLLDTIKEVATAQGLSVNAWVVRTLEQAAANPSPKSEVIHSTPALANIEPLLDKVLDAKLVVKLAGIEERLGKIESLSDGNDESLRQQELEALQPENQRLQNELGNSEAQREELNQQLASVRSQLETERADREELETQLSDLKKKSVPASQELLEAADLLNRLKAERKKSGASLADIQAILEMIEESWRHNQGN